MTDKSLRCFPVVPQSILYEIKRDKSIMNRYVSYTVEAAYYDHFGTRAFDNNNRLITLSSVKVSLQESLFRLQSYIPGAPLSTNTVR